MLFDFIEINFIQSKTVTEFVAYFFDFIGSYLWKLSLFINIKIFLIILGIGAFMNVKILFIKLLSRSTFFS